ncbi:50S ribosomal protein L23, partial [Rhizobiaceae bacterium]|nr:50S ribosomal protein L23 [Rhizobiaceae bacterium]
MSDIRNYDVIVAPVITEKATLAADVNQVVFDVARDASKPQIKRA